MEKRMIFKYLAGSLVFLIAAASWIYTWQYYERNQADIWLQIEGVVESVTLPFKLAALSREEPVETIPIPVFGVDLAQISDTWGDARADGRVHEGVDIFSDAGTPVYAAARGYVVRVGTNDLGGNIVFTVGPGGARYYYAHLERAAEGIDIGTPVTTDTVIGFVGNTGNAENSSPHLHFGLYHHGPQNPYPLLIDRD